MPTPMFYATAADLCRQALKSGHAEDDTAAVCAVLEKKAGVKRGKKKRANKRSK